VRIRLLVAGVVAFTAWAALANGQVILNGCGPLGDGKTAPEKLLNPLKNRFTIPEGVDPRITLHAMLSPGEDSTRFMNMDAASVIGFVIKEKLGGVESCNCHSSDPNYMDRHIYVGAKRNAKLSECAIVEVTPRFYKAHPDWILIGTRGSKLQGHIVEFTGWMFFDAEHKQNAVNTNPGNAKDWRATCWEIHPVVDIKVIE
jgi:hypothetical protein